MNKKQLAAAIAVDTGLTETQARSAVDAFAANVRSALAKGERVSLTGFGSFSVVERSEREGRNPLTGKPIKVPAKKVARFSPGKTLKQAVE